jgi:pimeloyl-ACP methyl ester carboxylesterase
MGHARTKNGTTLAYDVQGPEQAETILLINGLGAQRVGWRNSFRDKLAENGFRIFAIDNRDVGESSRVSGVQYTIQDMAQDCVEFCDCFGVDSLHIVGQSMGGMIAQEMALSFPRYVRSLALLYTSPDSTTYKQGEEFRQIRNALPTATNREQAVVNHLIREQACASDSPFEQDKDWLRYVANVEYERGADAHGIARQREALDRSRSRRDLVAQIDAPTLIIHGKADKLVNYHASIELSEKIRASDLLLVGRLGHEIHRDVEIMFADHIVRNCRRAISNDSRH